MTAQNPIKNHMEMVTWEVMNGSRFCTAGSRLAYQAASRSPGHTESAEMAVGAAK